MGGEREGDRDRQTDRERQTDRQRQRDRQTEREIEIEKKEGECIYGVSRNTGNDMRNHRK